MADRLRLGLIFGGRSVEHEVSVVSAQHVIAAADTGRFEVVPIGVTKEGAWLAPEETEAILAKPEAPFQKRLERPNSSPPPPFASTLRPGSGQAPMGRERMRIGRLSPGTPEGRTSLANAIHALESLDAVFPLVHGTHGEDGTLQGLLELLDLPYVGCGVAASAVGMDKALMKAAFGAAGIPVGEHIVVRASESETDALAAARQIEERIGYPAFVKPANGGSSVGVSKVQSREDLVKAFGVAAECDRKIIVEKAIEGREVECGILGNDDAEASPVGEIRYTRDFYDYEAKYLDPSTQILAPADLPTDVVERVQALALRTFEAVDGAGMSRVDFFLLADGSLMIDEINTIPGFTPASMYPRLWQAAGVSYTELITRLVDLALARHREKRIA